MPKISFLKDLQTYSVKEGTELTRLCVLYPSIPIKFGCRQGQCGTCAIHVIEGEDHLSPRTKQEIETLYKLKLGNQRLACQCAVTGDVILDV